MIIESMCAWELLDATDSSTRLQENICSALLCVAFFIIPCAGITKIHVAAAVHLQADLIDGPGTAGMEQSCPEGRCNDQVSSFSEQLDEQGVEQLGCCACIHSQAKALSMRLLSLGQPRAEVRCLYCTTGSL